MTGRRLALVLVALVAVAAAPVGSAAAAGTVPGSTTADTVAERETAATVAAAVTNGAATVNGTSVAHDGDEVTLESAPVVVEGTTNLTPGTTLSVRVRSTDPANPFLRTEPTVVDRAGSFRAVFDLREVPAGTTFQLSVLHDADDLVRLPGRVVECTNECTVGNDSSADATVRLDGADDTLTLQAGPGVTVAGTTDLPPGTTLNVRLRSTGSENPFIAPDAARVGRDGRFRAVFDLSAVDPGTDFTATIARQGGESLRQVDGRVVACTEHCEAPDEDEASSEPPEDESTPDVQAIVSTERGGTAEFPIEMRQADVATLTLGGPEANYRLVATVRDGDGDGSVVLRFDTGAVGSPGDGESPVAVADPDDSVTVGHESSFDPSITTLDAADYDVALYNASSPDDGTRVAVGTLMIRDTATGEDGGSSVEDVDFGLHNQILTVRQGESVEIPVVVGSGRTASLRIGGDRNLTVVALLREGPDPGNVVTLRLNTTGVEDGTPLLTTTSEDDSVTVMSTRGDAADASVLAEGDHDLAVFVGGDASGQPDSIGTLVVQPADGDGSDRNASDDGTNVPAKNGTNQLSTDDDGLSTSGMGALAVGGLLAVVGIALLAGIVRR